MSVVTLRLEAGGLVPANSKVDDGATEEIVARSYHHPALGDRPVVRLASQRLGEAEDLAMEFLGFEQPEVSEPLAIQHRRSLGFAAWALINDPDNARYALDLVKRMKAAGRKAKSKPGHAWDAFTDMSKELGKSAAHFLPPYWEEVGRTFKDLGNHTYAGRALTKSLEAERVHALESDRARRRDVVLEFVLAGCLSGKALSDYARDLMDQYSPDEAFKIFRDLCVRRTRGGMAPWAAMARDFIKVAKAADLDGDAELEAWLEEVIETPAMGRVSNQFWKSCKKHVKRIVDRSPAFAVALLRHTKPQEKYYDDKTLPWLYMLQDWGVYEYLWEDEHNGAPPLGEPIAEWFGRIIRFELPVPALVMDMLKNLEPRIKDEGVPLPLSIKQHYSADVIDVDVLETCLARGIKVDDPPEEMSVTFDGWLMESPDHEFRNSDVVHCSNDDRFKASVLEALTDALACRGGTHGRWRQEDVQQRPFPEAAGDRPGIKALWREHFARVLDSLDDCGLSSFETALAQLENTIWPESLKYFPELAKQLAKIDPATMLQRTLQAGVLAEYGWPEFEQAVAKHKIKLVSDGYRDASIQVLFPNVIVHDGVNAVVIGPSGVRTWELNLPKKVTAISLYPIGDDLAIEYYDGKSYERFLIWASAPKNKQKAEYRYRDVCTPTVADLDDGSVFFGSRSVRPGDKSLAELKNFFHDGQRFWRYESEYVGEDDQQRTTVEEIDPQTGKKIRASVPPFFEKTEGGEIDYSLSELIVAPAGVDDSPLGSAEVDGVRLLGWKVIKRRDGSYIGEGIDGNRWDKPLRTIRDDACPIALLAQPGTDEYLPVTTHGERRASYSLWDPSGSTVVASIQDFDYSDDEEFQASDIVLPIRFWHLMKVRDQASSKKLRKLSKKASEELLQAAIGDPSKSSRRRRSDDQSGDALANAQKAVANLIPKAPEALQKGVARVVVSAGEQASQFIKLRDKASAEAAGKKVASSGTRDRKVDEAAKSWDIASYYSYSDEEMSLSAHLSAVANFLKGDVSETDLPSTNYHWFTLLGPISMLAWDAMWRAVSEEMSSKDEDADEPWSELLALVDKLGLRELPGEFAEMRGVPEGWKKSSYGGYDNEVETGTSFAFREGEDAFILIENDDYGEEPYIILRYSTAQTPGKPPGYKVKGIKKLRPDWDSEEIQGFISAAAAAEEPPLPTKQELAATAEALNASPAEIALIWLSGLKMNSYENNFLPSGIRKALGLKVTEASAAKQSLSNLKDSIRKQLFRAVLKKGPSAPFAEDRGPVLAAIKKVWTAKMPKRLPIDAAMQRRLSRLARESRWQSVDHEELLSAAADPTSASAFRPRAMEIKLVKSRWSSDLEIRAGRYDFDAGILRSAAQLIGLVHSDSPAGAPARFEMPPLIKQVNKYLKDRKTILPLRDIALYDYGSNTKITPAQWLEKHVGKSRTDKHKVARLDDGLVVAAACDDSSDVVIGFRPSKLKSAGDLARLLGLAAIEVSEHYGNDDENIAVALLFDSPGFAKLSKTIMLKDLPEESWPQNPCLTAPNTVAAVAKEHKLSDEAAMLYLQVLALPDPTTSHIRKWNQWKPAAVKKASAELVKAKLVMQAKRSRAGRNIFLPGEWLELKTPWLPIETWKEKHLCDFAFDVPIQWPLGGPMVLRPFGDLFQAAWQRVVDGDVPKYEQVKRKRRRK